MKIKFGALVVAGSGKIGGHVAAKNRGGAYLRTKTTPSNPNTAAQAGARSLLASLSTGWGGLTDSQRASWNDAVASYATTDIFGDLRNPSGLNLYVKLNANLSNSGQALLTTAPTKIEVPFAVLQTAVFDLSDTTLTLTFADTQLDAELLKIQATPTVSPGVSFVKSQYRTIESNLTIAAAAALFDAYVAKFGVPVVGAKIFLSVAPIVATGQQGVAQTIVATVQA